MPRKFWVERHEDEYKRKLTTARLKREIRIIGRYINKKHCEIIDVPCGYGRISNVLAAKGYAVTGVDKNADFLRKARTDAKRAAIKGQVRYVHRDFLNFHPRQGYDLVLNIYSSLGYYESEAKNRQMLKSLFRLANPEGKIIIELFNPYRILENNSHNSSFKNKKGQKITYTRTYDLLTSVNITQIDKWRRQRHISNRVYCIRMYFPHELAEMALHYDCKLIDVLNTNGNTKDLIRSRRLWLIFKKYA